MTDYQPKPGDEVLLTIRARVGTLADGTLSVDLSCGDTGELNDWVSMSNPRIVRIEPAPIPVPTALGAVILAETASSTLPGRLVLMSGGRYPEDQPRWMRVGRLDETYRASEITRVHAVLLPGEES